MQQLPALSKTIISTSDSVRFSATENSTVQSKLKAIRDTAIPSVEEIKQQLNNSTCQLEGNFAVSNQHDSESTQATTVRLHEVPRQNPDGLTDHYPTLVY